MSQGSFGYQIGEYMFYTSLESLFSLPSLLRSFLMKNALLRGAPICLKIGKIEKIRIL